MRTGRSWWHGPLPYRFPLPAASPKNNKPAILPTFPIAENSLGVRLSGMCVMQHICMSARVTISEILGSDLDDALARS